MNRKGAKVAKKNDGGRFTTETQRHREERERVIRKLDTPENHTDGFLIKWQAGSGLGPASGRVHTYRMQTLNPCGGIDCFDLRITIARPFVGVANARQARRQTRPRRMRKKPGTVVWARREVFVDPAGANWFGR